MNYTKLIVTPVMAKTFLDTMGPNRRVNKARVDKYARDMKNGTFQNCIMPICFYENGKLFDGQHRLEAIIQSGVSVELTICYGIPLGTVVDNGLTRSLADILTMRENVSATFTKRGYTSLVNQYLAIKLKGKSKDITETEKENFIINNSEAIDLAMQISKKGANRPLCDRAGVHVAIFSALLEGVDENKLSSFCIHVNTGRDITENETSALILRNFLENKTNVTRGGSSINFLASTAEQAIRDFVSGKPRTQKYSKLDHVYIDVNKAPDFSKKEENPSEVAI